MPRTGGREKTTTLYLRSLSAERLKGDTWKMVFVRWYLTVAVWESDGRARARLCACLCTRVFINAFVYLCAHVGKHACEYANG